MNIKRNIASVLTHISVVFAASFGFAAHADDQVIRIGQTSGPHAEIMEEVKKIAAKDGLNIKVIEFSDYIQPNAALDSGDIDGNNYQTQAFLSAQEKARGYKFTVVAKTVLFPMGYYSKKYKNINELKNGDLVGIPNDPANSGRSLALLAKQGIIKLRDGVGDNGSVTDIVENKKKLKFIEIEAAQLPRSLDDLSIAAINTSFAVKAGLVPKRDAIILETAEGNPNSNLIVVRTADKDKPWVKKLVNAYHSEPIRQFIVQKFGDFAIPSF